jgi:hypothetical protein
MVGPFVPARLLLRAEIGAVKEFLQPQNLHFFLGGAGNQVLMLRHHFLFDLRERIFLRRPFTTGLDQAATDNTRHDCLPTNVPVKCWRKFNLWLDSPQGLEGGVGRRRASGQAGASMRCPTRDSAGTLD